MTPDVVVHDPGISIVTMSKHQNPFVNLFPRSPIFGGWLLHYMVAGCSNIANDHGGKDNLILTEIPFVSFMRPVLVGDHIAVYGDVDSNNGRIVVNGKMIVDRTELGINVGEEKFGLQPIEPVLKGSVIFEPTTPELMKKFKTAGGGLQQVYKICSIGNLLHYVCPRIQGMQKQVAA